MQPSQQLLNDVRAVFIRKGTSLTRYIRENKLDSNIPRYLRGEYTAEKATAAIQPILKATLPELLNSETQPTVAVAE